MVVLTKSGADVFAPTDGNSVPRKVGNEDAQTWATEIERGIANPSAPSYTVATVPSAATSGAGSIIFVADEGGGAVLAFSDGTDWRRITDRAVIS
ncbi:MAG: hypothetical protein BGN87_00095 [Rhizobiales bacterium 65-79]|nr:hypothetical protein [Hyphomicrobiales bacterium]OJU02586.1 MAG: hypothetical protein BGN87_00095 [Rhizobiales bacterium 65-79]